jgi:hypothetical protein
MSIELDKRSINHLLGGWGSARNGKLKREWSLMTLLLVISKGRLVAESGYFVSEIIFKTDHDCPQVHDGLRMI